MKTLFSTLLALTVGHAVLTSAMAGEKKFLVAIDPGHGGPQNPGTTYGSGVGQLMEKDVCLALAKEIKLELRNRGIESVLTREEDKDVPLEARTALANRHKADLFISIHMNSADIRTNPKAEGVETYILNNSTEQSSKRLADLENMVLAGSEAGGGKKSDVSLILKDLMIDQNLPGSKHAACLIQDALIAATQKPGLHHAKNRGVRQALFYVLLGADMPSLLVEAGFLSNRNDRARVLSSFGQKRMASAIAQAVLTYERTRGTPKSQAILSKCPVR